MLCSCVYSRMKHLRLIIGVGDQLKWLDTLKQTIKCTLGKHNGKKMMEVSTNFLILSIFVYSNWRNCQCLYCFNSVTI